jgi:hypothetical protein
MANLFKREFRPAVVNNRNTRSVQSNSIYLIDLFSRKKSLFIVSLCFVTFFVIFLNPSQTYSAKSIITFQLANLTQAGLISASDMHSHLGKTDNMRDRQIVFLSSFEFKRILADKIFNESDLGGLILGDRESLKIKIFNIFGLKKPNKATISSLADRLHESIKVSPNNDNNLQIEVFHFDSQVAKKLSTFTAQIALATIKEGQFQNIETNRTSLVNQIRDVKNEVDSLTVELQDFKRDNKIISTAAIPEDLKNSLSNLSRSLVESQIKLQETNYLLAESELLAKREQERSLESSQTSYIDQVLLMKIQELKDVKSSLEAKIKGTRNILDKENKRFEFYTSGEETIMSLRKKINEKLDVLSLLDQKLKQTDNIKDQIDYSVRSVGETYVQMKSGQFPLPTKLLIMNVFTLLIVGMGIFYWYEVFPVISYRDEEIVKMNLPAAPSVTGIGTGKKLTKELMRQAEMLFAETLVSHLGKRGIYQFLSISSKDGKSYMLSVVARYLVSQGASVCIVDLTCKGNYGDLPKEVNIIASRPKIDGLIDNPKHLKYYSTQSDWILVDSHSLEKDIGHMLVTSQMDGIILIGSYLETKRDQFIDWCLKLEHMAYPGVHFVLNKTNLREDMPFLLKAQIKKEKTSLRKVS